MWILAHKYRCAQKPEEGVTDGCETPDVGVGNQALILCKSRNVRAELSSSGLLLKIQACVNCHTTKIQQQNQTVKL